MKIAIVTTGDEVMQGIIVDTNTSWIAARCAAMGHDVVRHASAADDAAAIALVLRQAEAVAEAVIVTGGLGPTADDITVEAAAAAYSVPLERHESVLDSIRAFFTRVGRPMSSSNDKQALIPQGGVALENRVGTAPGIRVKLGNATFFFLPGVPKELYQIFDDAVAPWLAERASGAHAERVLRCFGIPEASIDEQLRGVPLGDCRLSFRVSFPEILLKLVARAGNETDARTAVEAAATAVREKLGPVVYAEGYATLPATVGAMLEHRGATLAVAESCTGGLVASLITDVPGASSWFERGVVVYSNRSKIEILGIPESVIQAHGAVSPECAKAMAQGIRQKSGVAIGIGITGIAGPSGGTAQKPVGTVHIALSTERGTQVDSHVFARDRLWFKQIVAWTALDMVRKHWLLRQEA